jgi:uncharacterized protein (TIGR02594 family)
MAMILQSVGRGGANLPTDVQLIQAMINAKIAQLAPLRPLRVDGQVGTKTVGAIEAFQSRVVGMELPDGRVDATGKTLKALTDSKFTSHTRTRVPLGARQVEKPTPQWLSVAAGEANWLSVATDEDGNEELAGHEQNNPRILEYLGTVPALMKAKTGVKGIFAGQVDETAWCACFVNWCLSQAGARPYPTAMAADWLKYGRALDVPVPGAITVVYKKPKTRADKKTTTSGYHVAFYVSGANGNLTLFGGNQGNKVCEKNFSGWALKGYRWPL